jgi:hypothetical protein
MTEAQVIDITPIEVTPDAEGAKALALVEQEKTLKITDKISYERVCESLLRNKDMQKKIDEVFDPIIEAANKSHKTALAQKKKFKNPLVELEANQKFQITTFLQAEETKRKAEEDRLRKLAEQAAEEARLAEAIQLEEEGDTEGAQVVLDEVPAYIPPPIVPKLATGQGIAMKTNWKFRVVDPAQIPREYLTPDMVKIGGVVRSMRDSVKIPGVEIYSENSIAAGRRG